MERDIFEDMKSRTGCLYVSDLPFCKRQIWKELKKLPLTDYPEAQLEDFCKYVFDISFMTLRKYVHKS